jgi:hypothetical protein
MTTLALVDGQLVVNRNSCSRRRSLRLHKAGGEQNTHYGKNRILQRHLFHPPQKVTRDVIWN